MTWRAIVHRGGMADLPAPGSADIAQRGSLVVETRLAAVKGPQTILAMQLTQPHHATLTLKALPGGGVVLVIARKGSVYHATVKLEAEARTDILRITYSWDLKGGAGRLAIEWPERQVTRWVHTGPAVPLSAADMGRIGGFFDLAEAHPDLIFAGLSDIIEPLGPMPSLAGRTPVLSQHGYRAVQDLRRGDLLSDHMGGAPHIVLNQVSRVVPALGSFAPVRLRAPYFGLLQDVIVAPDQRLLIGGSEVEYTFGCEQVLVPARHLVNGIAAIWERSGPLAQYVQVVLPEHVPVIAAGTIIESLFVGRLRRNRDALNASMLGAENPMFLPEQARAPYRVLSPFEAITLAERRAA
ncbi:Hint domain-containing protein [Roseobacteraceae bacterium S113]